MSSIRRTIGTAVALAAAVSLAACNDSDPVVSGGSSSKAPSSSSAAPTASSPSSSSPSRPSSAAPSTSASGAPGTSAAGKSAKKGSVKDKTAIPVEQIKIPTGPVTAIDVKLWGGYSKTGSKYGVFYTALNVTSTKPGLLRMQYVLLDASGKTLKTIDDSTTVGGTTRELRVNRTTGELPAISNGKVAKVRLVVTSNTEDQQATVTQIENYAVKIGRDASTSSAKVSGRYRTIGTGVPGLMTAICVDKSGLVQADEEALPDNSAPKWTPFSVRFLSAVPGFRPKSCYVGT